ncbi:MAG: glycosyltransferase [Gammaproteobacteria bacterium]
MWKPTINGLVTILSQLSYRLRLEGHQVYIVQPGLFSKVVCPWYPDVNLALNLWDIDKILSAWKPCSLHIASEGPMGFAARRWAISQQLPFTSAIHTRMDIHLSTNLGIPATLVERYMKWFHARSSSVLVHTEQQKSELVEYGYQNLRLWRQGVNANLFKPVKEHEIEDYLLFVGRISAEKQIDHFLKIPTRLRKVVVGDGPALASLKKKYPDVTYTGLLRGKALAAAYAKARALVMPSHSETLGIVILEALASGVPVAAYPVTGPIGIIQNGVNGWLDDNLEVAIERALQIDRKTCYQYMANRGWDITVDDFLDCLKAAPLIHWNGSSLKPVPSLSM